MGENLIGPGTQLGPRAEDDVVWFFGNQRKWGWEISRNGKVTTLEVKLFKHVFVVVVVVVVVVVEIFTLKNVGEDERIHSDEKDFEQLTHLVRVGSLVPSRKLISHLGIRKIIFKYALSGGC